MASLRVALRDWLRQYPTDYEQVVEVYHLIEQVFTPEDQAAFADLCADWVVSEEWIEEALENRAKVMAAFGGP